MAGIGAGLVVAGYNSMAPKSQLYGRTFVRNQRLARQIALTYDDGPNDPHTLHLLDVLAKHNVLATFFMIGRYVRERPDIALEVKKRHSNAPTTRIAMSTSSVAIRRPSGSQMIWHADARQRERSEAHTPHG